MTFTSSFKALPKTGLVPSSNTSEILVAPLSGPAAGWSQKLEKLSAFPTKLSADALAHWKRLSAKETAAAPFKALSLSFTDGTSLQVVLVSPKISAYELHTGLRKSVESCFGSEQNLVINLKALDAKLTALVTPALAALSVMAGWKPASFGKKAEEAAKEAGKKPSALEIHWLASLTPKALEAAVQQGLALGRANNLVRTLADLPSNELNPRTYHDRAKSFAKEHKLGFDFWSIADLAKQKAGAFLAVNSADPKSHAGIAILKYSPARKSKNTPVLALVGKGLCFDTGGYNVKTGSYMYGMHGDMTGSAIALAMVGYFAEMQAPFEVHAYLALAENLISPTAYKPNDVVVACDGTSIEVVDTDAEGRMVLSDTLALVRRTKPTLCIDYATLTGAAIRSLDTRRSAVFSNDTKLALKAVEAGEASGERTWSFPIGGDYREVLKSKIADIVQCAPVNNADHIYAATFLSHFIGDETPWVHVDLVAAENKGGLGLASSDTTGFGVMWTNAFVNTVMKGGRK